MVYCETKPNSVVDRVLDRIGYDINIGTPLGLGKPVQLLNSFYRRAESNPEIDLTIVTALSLKVPEPKNDLERRLTEPLYERIFGDYPKLEYAYDLENDELPPNVDVKEFYVQPGTRLHNEHSQQNYINTNYTYAIRDIIEQDVNVLAQLVTPARSVEGQENTVHSLSCNPDLTLDVIDRLDNSYPDRDYVLLGQVNENLPFMYGDCFVPENRFDVLLKEDELNHKLFGPPSEPLDATDYAIGLHVSRLVPDGGTLQIGIGSLGDAISKTLVLRHRSNEAYRRTIDSFPYARSSEPLVEELGGEGTFDRGLYASTEMFVRGFEELMRAGVLSREVFEEVEVQRFVNDQKGDLTVKPELIERLVDAGVIEPELTESDLDLLKHFGIVEPEVSLDERNIVLPDGTRVRNDLNAAGTLRALETEGLGTELKHGLIAHAGFFLGPPSMYDFLRELSESERKKIRMDRISFVNDLFGRQELKEAQRKNARFVNSGMKVTLTGAVVSDALENMRTVSGVGGQYNFVSMAQNLPGARSIIMIRSTRESDGELESNVVWNYGHNTIPRHLRDIVVTEYGIADLRGLTDQGVVEEMLSVTDARFQDDLVESAKESDKLPEDWTLPDSYRENTPETVNDWFDTARTFVDLPDFPFGSELTQVEIDLARGLKKLREKWDSGSYGADDLKSLPTVFSVPVAAKPHLERMNLLDPETWSEWLQQKAVLLALDFQDVL